jgi:hypothetical protein
VNSFKGFADVFTTPNGLGMLPTHLDAVLRAAAAAALIPTGAGIAELPPVCTPVRRASESFILHPSPPTLEPYALCLQP